jgi:eukaryotic-like serine/threonine-protein kinase
MPLTFGTKLGPYEIKSPLGAGGMGEVYHARDTRLGREVAIKVLPEHLSKDPELKLRLEREAKAISSLNHPHICTLHDIGSQDGVSFLVMEYVDGQTLAERLKKGPLPIDQVLKIGTEVALALQKAHEQGIIHRDLKPANIMLTSAGAKLMDFGLAKPKLNVPASAVSSSFTPSTPTMNLASLTAAASPLTQKGSIVGTFQYMAPEVLQGTEADARSDIFSLGCVLYEMVTGRHAFEGKSQLSVFTSILEQDPQPISAIQPLTPPLLESVVRGCLAKDPAERMRSAYDVAMNLKWAAAGGAGAASVDKDAPVLTPNRVGWMVGIATVLILGALGTFFAGRPSASGASVRASINPPPDSHFRLTSDVAGPPVLSPDGAYLAFTANGNDGGVALWVRPMNGAEARPLPDTTSAIFPFWAPDSHAVGFFADGKLKTIELNGSTALTLGDALLGRGGAWATDGTILFSPSPIGGLQKINAGGGTPAPFLMPESLGGNGLAGPDLGATAAKYSSYRWPFMLPDGKHFLYFAMHHDPSKVANNAVFWASLDGRENKIVMHAQGNAIYAAGFLLFNRGEQLLAQPFDAGSGKLRGEPQTLSSGVLSDVSTWHTSASATENGLLTFGSGSSGGVQLVWIGRDGKQGSVAADNIQNLQNALLSPQGDRVALDIDNGVNDVWVLDLARGVKTRLTFGPTGNTFPVWSPDGKWIAFSSLRAGSGGIYRKPADGSGAEELLVPYAEGVLQAPNDWSHDGKTLLYSPNVFTQKGDGIWAIDLEGDRKSRIIVPHGTNASLSPNERWLAYSSAESGRLEVYVQAYGGQGRWQVSANGAQVPHWSADGKELYYFDADQSIVAVPVTENGGALEFGAPQTLVKQWTVLTIPFFSVAADGTKVLMERVSQQVNQPVTLMTNFAAGLKR